MGVYDVGVYIDVLSGVVFCVMKLVVVRNLRHSVTKNDIKEKFEEHGLIAQIKYVQGSGIAHVEFEDKRDAQDAIDELDDTHFRGSRIKVEYARTWQPGDGPRTEHRLYVDGLIPATEREHLIEFASRVAPPSYVVSVVLNIYITFNDNIYTGNIRERRAKSWHY